MKRKAAAIVAACGIVVLTSSAQAQARERVRSNDNRARAGVLSGKVLAIRMEARLAEWHPDGEDRPGAVVPVFAEIGRQASIPGPLIRVPAGTDVITVVRNAVPNTVLTIHGLHSRPAIGAAFNDSIQLAYGQIQTLRFRLDRPGTYYYWGTTTGSTFLARDGEDAQLTGAIVVDEPDERQPKDRILVIGGWSDSVISEHGRHERRELLVVNGRSWPQTDRLTYERGETVRWRVINASTSQHPMHLHGFYFRVQRRGDGKADTAYAAQGGLVNTERMLPGETMAVTWVADRLGGWLFHCHIPAHIARHGPLGLPLQQTVAQSGDFSAGSTIADMGGLVTAIEVRPAEEDTAVAAAGPAPALPKSRHLRMLLRPVGGASVVPPRYDVAFDELGLDPPVTPERRAGPQLVLNRGEPVSITVINRLSEPTSVHWHGIELESYYDGVPGISGVRPQIAPVIAPGDSFEVRFTPQRAGTFMYHTHVNETRQQRAGLAGALIVAERGAIDPSKDVSVLISSPSDSAADGRSVLINGSLAPLVVMLRRGVPMRLRLINMTTDRPDVSVELRRDTTLATWRVLARNGAVAAAADRAIRPASQGISVGEAVDVEVVGVRAGDMLLEIRDAQGNVLGALPLRVE